MKADWLGVMELQSRDQKAAGGDSQRLSAEYVASIYAEHGDAISRFLVGILRDSALAADCLQATFAKLLERGHETRPEGRRGWLFTVAYQEAMLAKRRDATTQRVLEKAVWTRPTPTLPGGEEIAIAGETTERLKQLLATLPSEQQLVVRKRIYEDKTFAVIAEELQVPLGTVLWRMRTALAKLREQLKSDG